MTVLISTYIKVPKMKMKMGRHVYQQVKTLQKPETGAQPNSPLSALYWHSQLFAFDFIFRPKIYFAHSLLIC